MTAQPSQAALDFAEDCALRWFGSTEALDCAELARAFDRFAASRLAAYRSTGERDGRCPAREADDAG